MLLAKGGKHGSKTFKEIFWLIIGWSLSYTDTRVPPRNTSLKIKAQYISHAKRFHYVKWVLPALVYPRVEMDQLKEKVLSRTINKGSEEDIFLYLKPSEDSTQKCHWRSKVISILWTKSISVSRRVLYKKKLLRIPIPNDNIQNRVEFTLPLGHLSWKWWLISGARVSRVKREALLTRSFHFLTSAF